MTAHADCLQHRRVLIARADRNDLAAAQDLVLRFALSHADPARRGTALEDLYGTFARDAGIETMSTPQQAFRAALLAMIARTREAFAAAGPAHP